MNENYEPDLEEFLAHFGVKGMKWGVRNPKAEGVSRSINKTASKDAKEFAEAKQFYGQGAGTRRKLIKETVEQRTKNSSEYKKAFDFHLQRQDMAKASEKAVSKRKSIDRRTRTKQRAGYLARTTTGQMGTQAAFTAVAVAGLAFASSPVARQKAKSAYSNVANAAARYRGAAHLSKILGL